MSHRDYVKPELVKFLDRYALLNGKGKKVLEIGPGDDIEFKNYWESLGYEYMSVDCNSKYESKYCKRGNMENLPFSNNEFDIVFSCHSFEHTEAPTQALKEMRRVSKKYVIVFTPYPCEHQILKADIDHINVLSDMQIERLFRWCNITKINIYYDKKQELEQDWNVCAFGEK